MHTWSYSDQIADARKNQRPGYHVKVPVSKDMAASIDLALGVLFIHVRITRGLVFGIYIRAPGF